MLSAEDCIKLTEDAEKRMDDGGFSYIENCIRAACDNGEYHVIIKRDTVWLFNNDTIRKTLENKGFGVGITDYAIRISWYPKDDDQTE